MAANCKDSKVLRQREMALQEMRSAGGWGCFSRAVFLLVFGGLPINGAGHPSSCAGNRTHSAGLTRVYTKIEKKWRQVHQINIDGGKDKELDGSDFSEAILSCANFEGASLKKANFNGADLSLANFKEAKLQGASFCKTHLQKTNFSHADITEGTFNHCYNIESNIFTQTNLNKAVFIGYLGSADFSNSKHQNANFHEADKSEAQF